MRIRFFLAITAASTVLASFAVQACGATDDTTPTTTDAAPETSTPVNDAAAMDTSMLPDVFDARPPCDPNKDILAQIPDASLADGATTTGECLACVELKCSKEVSDCKKDCSRSSTDLGCQDLAAKALTCYTVKQSFLMCAGDFGSAKMPTQGIGIALGTCVAGNCKDPCGVPEGGIGP